MFETPTFHLTLSGEHSGFMLACGILLLILFLLLHLACCLGVLADAERYQTHRGGTALLGRGMWGVVALLLGPGGVLIYWVIHRSSLRVAEPSPPAAA